MKEKSISSASFEGKSKFNLPPNAVIIKEDYSLRVEEIENGYLVCKNYDIQYQIGDNKEYTYHTKKWFSKDNPMKITEPKEKSLAEKLD